MSIFRIDLIDVETSIDESYYRESTRTYRVFASTGMDENQVRNGLGFGIYNLHPTDRQQIIKRISVKLESKFRGAYDNQDNPSDTNIGSACLVWTATLEYGPWNPQDHTATGNPMDQPVGVFFESVTYEEVIDLDTDGNPVVNTAGDFFDPPLTRDRTRPVLKIIRNELMFSDSTILAYADKVNEDMFYKYPPKTLKCSAPRAEQKYSQDSDLVYYRVEYQLEFNPDRWTKKALNQGYRQLRTIGGSPKQAPILDGTGQPISTPFFLTTGGVALTPPVAKANIIQLEFDVYDTINFTGSFGFPIGLLS